MDKDSTQNRLKKAMEEKGLKQVDLLKLVEPYCKKYNVKIGKSYLSQYLSGTIEPTQSRIFILAQALGVSEAWLMGFDAPMTKAVQKEKAELSAQISKDDELLKRLLAYYSLTQPDKDVLKSIVDAYLSGKGVI